MTVRLNDDLKTLLEAHPAIAPTGRIKSFLFHPERKTLAPSCMLRVYKGELAAEIQAISWYLQTNAGIKVHLHPTCLDRWKPCKFKWYFDIGDNHPDIDRMDVENSARKWRGEDVDYLLVVDDTMESIRASWVEFINMAQKGGTILVDLSAIRAAGKSLETKIVSTGVFGLEESDEGFLSVYKWLADYLNRPSIESLLVLFGGLCKVVARGGTHKNGIVTTSCNANAPFIWEYLDFPLGSIPGGSKKAVRFDESVLEDERLCERIVRAVNEESVFLEKITYQETVISDVLALKSKRELYVNVCQAIYLDHSASCLITPVNVAQCRTPEELVEAFVATTKFLCQVHTQWRQMAHNYNSELYLSLEEDKQVAVTVLGLGSFLAAQEVSYQDHVDALQYVRLCKLHEESKFSKNGISGNKVTELVDQYNALFAKISAKSLRIAYALNSAYAQAACVARKYGLERAFSVEPTQRCYLDYKDLQGYTVSRQIDPPFSNPEARESSVHGEDIVQYHPLIETASEVGHELHMRHHEEWQLMMESTGLAHGSSFDLYEPLDLEGFKYFVKDSPLRSTYYQQTSKVNQDYLDKGNLCVIDDPDCVACGS